ncbi:MAG: ferrochelatase [Candidatus Hydrogenedentota bacterium]
MGGSAVLLINLGSPDSTQVPDVRRYLREFLMDERVIDSPFPVRLFVVEGMILPFRPKETAKAYASIWTADGSPLVVTSRTVRRLLQERIAAPVELGMRYGNPSIREAVSRLAAKPGITRIHLVPLYPHYAMSSYETCVVKVREELKAQAPNLELTLHPPFYEDPMYIDAMVEASKKFLETDYDLLLFSFHGLPVRHLKLADPTHTHCQQVENCCETKSIAHDTCYRAQAFKTVRAFVKRAGIPRQKYAVAFQSRLGRDPWLTPFTDHELERFGKEGVKKILVICPSFVSDCLETLEEIAVRGRETFLEAGGEDLKLIPCLNDHPRWIDTLEYWCKSAGATV